MKTLIIIVVSFILSLLTASAQTETKSTSESKTNITISIDGEIGEQEHYYSSFSTIDMEDYFKIKVRFMESKLEDVRTFLLEQLGKEYLVVDDSSYIWKEILEGDYIYKVHLKNEKLRITVDKVLVSDKLLNKFKQLGKDLKKITSKENKS